MKIFSYIVDHDTGLAPNPSDGFCTLVHCKFGGLRGRSSIVEKAQVGDWILGSGGKSIRSAGNGKIIYLMRIDEKIPFKKFLTDKRFDGRKDQKDFRKGNLFALVSKTYYYFGKNAPHISELPSKLVASKLLKTGPGYRRDLAEKMIIELTKWFSSNYTLGTHGDPCASK